MSTKHTGGTSATLMVCVLIAAAMLTAAMIFAAKPGAEQHAPSRGPEYEQELFDGSKPIEIDICMDESEWKGMLEDALKKEWKACDVFVNGTRFCNVGIRTKGDSSLTTIAEDPKSQRYSFKLRFDKYREGQTCFGLDKLCLNNNYGDATNMKEALAYDMFHFLGADASLYNFAKVSVNGRYWGCYLALEAVDEAFLSRSYGARQCALYKPGSGVGLMLEDDGENVGAHGSTEGGAVSGGALFDEGMVSEGADLMYTGDDLSRYRAIWEGEVTKMNKADHRRVVTALKHIGEKTDLETYMDVDNVLRYMAVHNFLVNLDSLSGDGDHNYYLLESKGALNIIPWDYNLCLGGYELETDPNDVSATSAENSRATSTINFAIDDPWALTSFFDGILQDERLRARYHEHYRHLIDGYVQGGGFDTFLTRTRSQIDDLVRDDPHALFDYAAYDRAADTLARTVALRGVSVSEQLRGTIPSTSAGQRLHPETLVDAKDIDLSSMGTDGDGPYPAGSDTTDGAVTRQTIGTGAGMSANS